MSKTVVLFSGRGRHGAGNIARKLTEHGVEIAEQVEGDKKSNPLSIVRSNVKAIIVLHDTVSHWTMEFTRDLSAKSGVPRVLVPRSWAHAAPKLREAGIIESVDDAVDAEYTTQEEEQVVPQQPVIRKQQAQSQAPKLPARVEEAVRLLVEECKTPGEATVVKLYLERQVDGTFNVQFEVIATTTGAITL